MEKVISHADFTSKAAQNDKSFLLLYKTGNEQSQCAFQNLEKAGSGTKTTAIFAADVAEVRDIHTNYGISSVPSLLIFEKGKFVNVVKGCQENTHYKALLDNAIYQPTAKVEGKPAKRVTVYSTPTCSWCNTLKSWLQKNHVHYADIDISADDRAAQELVKRSGQQGVPQTDINGEIVVGFDQNRLKNLLGLQ